MNLTHTLRAPHGTLALVLGTSFVALGSGCKSGGALSAARPPAAYHSGTEAERYFPLQEGRTYSYDVTSEGGAPDRWLIAAKRTSNDHGELRTPTGVKAIEYRPDGVFVPAKSAYLLKFPLAEGASWEGEHGGAVRVLSANTTIDTPAGSFSGCVQTVEEVATHHSRFLTTFCPEIGIVTLEASSDRGREKATLHSYSGESPDHGSAVLKEAR